MNEPNLGLQFVTKGGPIDREMEQYIERGCTGPVPQAALAITGANGGAYERPMAVPEQGQKREVLLVDQRGNALLVREPRRIGFHQR